MNTLNIDSLAQEIRRVDGNHSLGAGALAEALMPFLSAVPPQGGEQTADIERLRSLGDKWMSQEGRDELDDWIAAVSPQEGEAKEPSHPQFVAGYKAGHKAGRARGLAAAGSGEAKAVAPVAYMYRRLIDTHVTGEAREGEIELSYGDQIVKGRMGGWQLISLQEIDRLKNSPGFESRPLVYGDAAPVAQALPVATEKEAALEAMLADDHSLKIAQAWLAGDQQLPGVGVGHKESVGGWLLRLIQTALQGSKS